MAKLYFRYGTMNASKSLQALMVVHNYEEQGKVALLLVPEIADRDGFGIVSSRVGIQKTAIVVKDETNIVSEITQRPRPNCVVVDEAQFLSRRHVMQLVTLADELSIPVIAYGLLKDYRAEFFEGSAALVLMADSIEEIKTVCVHSNCERKATMILKVKDGVPVHSGEQIEIGDAQYQSLCRHHYLEILRDAKVKSLLLGAWR